MTDLQTIRKYEFTDGTIITLKIDRQNNKVSFVEPEDIFEGVYKNKRWLFANRGLEYMNGWLNILNCMEYAIEDAKKDLESYGEQKTNKLIDVIAQVGKDGNS